MAEIKLWLEDLEPLRADTRQIADAGPSMFAGILGPSEIPPAGRVARQRQKYDRLRPRDTDPMPELAERAIARVRCRSFVPAGPTIGQFLQIRGGGRAVGRPEEGDADNVRCCRELGLVVGPPDHRHGPERPYPAAFDDTMEVVARLIDTAQREWGVDPRMVIGGGSAGAHRAAGDELRILLVEMLFLTQRLVATGNQMALRVHPGCSHIACPEDRDVCSSQRGDRRTSRGTHPCELDRASLGAGDGDGRAVTRHRRRRTTTGRDVGPRRSQHGMRGGQIC